VTEIDENVFKYSRVRDFTLRTAENSTLFEGFNIVQYDKFIRSDKYLQKMVM